MDIKLKVEDWELRQPFRITGEEWRHSTCITVELQDGDYIGRGEAQGVSYLGETADTIVAQINSVADDVRAGVSREELQTRLPSGGARNAIDCALWDLEAKSSGQTIWTLTGIEPQPVTTVFTIGIEETAEAMAAKAAGAAEYPVLKVKLDNKQPYERLAAIRAARPDARIVVDANQGWTFELLCELLPRCVELEIDMVEQPLPRGQDEQLDGFNSPVTLAADESCQDCSELETAARRYDMINIKLDKTGGLTEALRLARAAREAGCKLMVGNMLGTSLSMAPSFVIAQLCDFVDIDGPLLMKEDRIHGLRYKAGEVAVFDRDLWG
ncbi:N-acetyl-D-Glu racemase DgcA [Woeseia oceani]|uniref:Dipeptide epimerase n=1 Tax=Woeseia oceani TaxID=1548547 RepID=A0A193LGV0_9GAMM|nr:N-acetyl-D-Glu racemase DgcA [Woeseia oceani]ANO51737.1 dipeptide epimerase [Woeseia oceani]